MKEKAYFYASTEENLVTIPKDSKLYDKLTICILEKSCELMSNQGIRPASGILTCAESGDKEYTIIERYDNHFLSLNCSVFIYYIPQNHTKVINDKTFEETRVLKKQKIDNLYEYLQNQKNITLIQNDNLDKSWYGIPYDNGDIIQKYFLNISKEENKSKQKNKINNLEKLFPEQSIIIRKLEKLMFRMNEDVFVSFVNTIYNKRNRMINYDTIKETEEEYSIKRKVKKLLNINQ